MSKASAHSMRGQDEWGTPPEFFRALDAEFAFTLDPCATAENAKLPHYFSETENGLAKSWKGETVFMNPPFSRCAAWVAKARAESEKGATVVCLLPARVDTDWWHRYCLDAEIRWIRGRLRYVGGRYNAPFPSVLVIFRPGAAE